MESRPTAPRMLYRSIDMHTAGEPVRIMEGFPRLNGATILEKRREAQELHDSIRRRLMLEPRGHADMYGVIPVEPSKGSGAHLGVLFTHNSGYSTMCGHATIAIGRWAVESGLVKPTHPTTTFGLECPCGVVEVTAHMQGAAVRSVSFKSVPGFALFRDLPLEIDGIGRIVTDIAYGGAFYALLPASRIGLRLRESPLSQLVSAAGMITRHIRRVIKIAHPIESDLSFLYGTILTDDEAADSGRATHNICVFGDSQVDRSPTGSGVVARMALDFAKGLLTPGATREFVGPSEQSFHGTLESPEAVAQHAGVRVRVAGCAYYTGRSEFIVEESDPLADGFSIGDMQHH